MMSSVSRTAAIILGCTVLLSCGQQAGMETGNNNVYGTVKVTAKDIVLSDSYPASIQGRQDIAIFPQVSGTISKVCVKEGQKVRKGQSLFIIDQVPFKAALQMAQANVKAAEAGVATARLVYDSRKALHEKEVISDYDLQTSYNQLLTAQAQLAQAKAQEVTANNNMAYTMVLSPADGVVGTLPYREGALVSPSIPQPLTTVSDNSQMYVYFSITENRLLDMTCEYGSMDEALASFPKVQLKLNNGSIYKEEGYVETVSGVIDQSTGSASVRAVFPNKGGILHSGASGQVVLPRTIENAVVIPCTATFEMQDLVFAYRIVDGRTQAARLSVKLSDDGRSYVVNSGLSEGDIILAEGVGMVREGQAVQTRNATEE
ncbi:MAG: efflux RND transporter periplasmic adaptor subunit [Clostridium sp.]|nr:efflux RND transporter periplasmic adaptor subunit [Bacteroides sp.]MCM1198879.1 efflux RND transporter periplasmic adaptor subunit [Clostridium sp.]